MSDRGTIMVTSDETTGRITLRFGFPGQRPVSFATDLERLRWLVVEQNCDWLTEYASEKGLVQARAQMDGILAQIEAEFAARGTPTRCEP